MRGQIIEQQKVVVNGQCDLYMDSDSRKFIGQVCVVQKQCKNGKYLVKHPDGTVYAFAKKNLDAFENND